MNLKIIKEILKLFGASKLNKLEIKDSEIYVNMEKSADTQEPVYNVVRAREDVVNNSYDNDNIIDFNNAKNIVSPMVGIYYSAPSPDSPPYVKIGDKVKKGDTLCLIEAMKVMSEINSDIDGEIVDICAENGELVEYSQVLFKIV